MINKTSSYSNDVFIKILAFFSIYVFWGSTYLLNKIAVTELPPFMLASIRFVIAGAAIFIIARFMGFSLRITKRQLINCFIAGFLFLTYGNGVFVWGLKYVDSGFASLLVSTQPLVVLVMMWALQGKRIRPKSYIGVILGVIGIFLLVNQKQLIHQEGSVIAIVMMFSCIISWGFGSLFVGKADLPSNFFINTGYQMLVGGAMLIVVSLYADEIWSSPVTWSYRAQLSVLGLIIFGSIIAFTAFNYLLKVVSPEKVATSTYINPVIALLLGWYFLNEHISGQSIIATVILLTGVYFINSNRGRIFPVRRLYKNN